MIVKYSKKFPYAPYLNEDIGFEMQVDAWGNGIDEEKIIDGLNKLKAIAEKFHKENNPQLEPPQAWPEQSPTIVHEHIPGYTMTTQRIPAYQTQPIPSIDPFAIETLEKMIDDSQTLADLEQLDSKTILDYRLVEHYNARWNDLHEQTRNK